MPGTGVKPREATLSLKEIHWSTAGQDGESQGQSKSEVGRAAVGRPGVALQK